MDSYEGREIVPRTENRSVKFNERNTLRTKKCEKKYRKFREEQKEKERRAQNKKSLRSMTKYHCEPVMVVKEGDSDDISEYNLDYPDDSRSDFRNDYPDDSRSDSWSDYYGEEVPIIVFDEVTGKHKTFIANKNFGSDGRPVQALIDQFGEEFCWALENLRGGDEMCAACYSSRCCCGDYSDDDSYYSGR